ncbi:MAG: PAS domain S-box protein [Candidatus Hermodarchaeota archaeon]
MTSLNVILGNFEEACINSIESIFDAYFLLSKENIVLAHRIKDELLNLYFGKKSFQGEDFFNILKFLPHQEDFKDLRQKILEKEPQLFELSINVNGQISYYNIFIFILANEQMLINFQNINKQKKIEFELAEERNTLKNIIELNPYAIEIKDVEGRHVSANKAFIDMFKSVAPPEYSIFKDPHIIKRGLMDKIIKLKEGKVIRMGEHWYDVRDSARECGLNLEDYPSSPICHKAVAFPIFDRNGKIKNYVMMHEDITARKKAEEKLRESEERFRSLVETTSDWIWEVDANSVFTYSSPKIRDILGYKPEEVIGKTPFDLMPKNEAERVEKIFQTIVDPDKSFKILENKNLHKDGSLIVLETSGIPIFDDNRQLLGYRGINRDITERKKAEQKLKESEEMYRNLFNTTPYAIWLVDLQGKILDCNETMDKFLAIFKYTDLIGKPFREVLKMFAREGDPRFENIEKILKERFKILLKKGYLKPIEFEVYRGDGKTFWITLESSFVKIDKKSLIQTFIKDITEKKLAEIELEGLRKDLETRVKERTIKLENSEKKYRKAYNRADCYKGLFTHDISNIFQIIGNSIELSQMQLEESIIKKELLECFEVIAQQIKRGKSLINNIRNLSEIEESEMPLKSTEIFEKLRSAIQFVRINFQKREININIKSDVDELYVLANDLLLDVFENILINAVRYNKDEAVEIVIDISRVIDKEKAYIRLQFKDNGIGINDNKKKLIFDKNYKKKIGSKGMGLGLSLVAKLLDLCKGKIWVEDRIKGNYTKGSNFIIQIPEAT